jgi:hypothetical protein
MIFPTTKNLIETAKNPARKPADVDAAGQKFFAAVENLTKAEKEEQMAALAEHFDLPDVHRSAFLALMCGALVEQGCDPQPMAAPLRAALKKVLESCGRLLEACRAKMPAVIPEDDDDSDDSDEAGYTPAEAAFMEARQQVAPKMPKENEAWEALKQFWRPAIAAYTKNDMARIAAQSLRPLALPIAEFHEGGHWLQLVLSVLDNEPLVVIEPETNTGVLARISGVVDNFQLHILLMDAFPRTGNFSGRRVPLNIAEMARGSGPQELEEMLVTGYWNLYTYQALQANKQLPPSSEFSSSTHWIWNEGLPADIPVLAGRRVVLLGPPSIERTWRAMRTFDFLRANLTIEKQLSAAEVDDWLQKMVAAKS